MHRLGFWLTAICDLLQLSKPRSTLLFAMLLGPCLVLRSMLHVLSSLEVPRLFALRVFFASDIFATFAFWKVSSFINPKKKLNTMTENNKPLVIGYQYTSAYEQMLQMVQSKDPSSDQWSSNSSRTSYNTSMPQDSNLAW